MSLLSQVATMMAEDQWTASQAIEVLEVFRKANQLDKDGDSSKISIEEINGYLRSQKKLGVYTLEDTREIRNALYRPSTIYNACLGSETSYDVASIDILDGDSSADSLSLFLTGDSNDLKSILMAQLQRTEPEYYHYLNPTAEELAARGARAARAADNPAEQPAGIYVRRSDNRILYK